MEKLTDKFYAVEVPDSSHGFSIEYGSALFGISDEWLLLFYPEHGHTAIQYKTIPPGSWQFLFTTKEATDEDAHKIVESVITANEQPVYWDYEFSMWMRTSVGSLQSLLQSKGCDVNKNWAIIENI